jgi:DNA-binding transcriptional regulator LsrR (DeoR family)
MIPLQFAGHVSTIRGFLGWINGYRAIFGEPPERGARKAGRPASPPTAQSPLVERLDMVLTGAGVPSRHSRSVWLQERLVSEGFRDLAELASLVIGDIGGCYLPRHDLDAKARQRVRGINARWTGIQVDHLRRCAERAARARSGKGPRGVVIVALGKEKAEVVAECVRLGIVTRLIIDHELAQALAARLPA